MTRGRSWQSSQSQNSLANSKSQIDVICSATCETKVPIPKSESCLHLFYLRADCNHQQIIFHWEHFPTLDLISVMLLLVFFNSQLFCSTKLTKLTSLYFPELQQLLFPPLYLIAMLLISKSTVNQVGICVHSLKQKRGSQKTRWCLRPCN